MKRRKRLITVVIILALGYLFGSGLIDEISVRLTMAMKLTKTLDYYEYHWRGDKQSRLLSMSLYSYQKQGTQRKCLEYVPISAVEAALESYMLESFDSQGNCIYQKRLTTEGTEETYWTYTYDEQERITEKAVYVEKAPRQLQKYHYYENGMSAGIVYDYQGDFPAPELSYMTLYDGDGWEFLHRTYSSEEDTQDTGRITLSLGAYGREELICEGDDLIAYRWYDYNASGNVSYLLEITPEGTDPVQYLCTYSIYDYDTKGRLEAVYRYQPVMEEHRYYYNHYRSGDVDTGIFLNFDGNGQLNGLESLYFMDEDQPGEVLYYLFPLADGTFELATE